MPGNIRIFVDEFFDLIAGKTFDGGPSLTDNRCGTLFAGNRRHLPKVLSRFGQFGYLFPAFDHGEGTADELEEVDILVPFSDNDVAVLVVFLVGIDQIGRQAFLVGDRAPQGFLDTGYALSHFLQSRIS
ncbi:MAG: hypothetical protein ACD_75C00760G0001 [uncultured bacterium]|nr:MAG: hypothetical protein ACD_75C00760G0001 [uncultured bacterium]